MLSALMALIESESDKQKFEQIYKKYKDLIYNISYKYLNNYHLAQDATQESFTRIAKSISSFDEVESDDTIIMIYLIAKRAAYYIYNRNNILKEEFIADFSDFIDYNQYDNSEECILDAIKNLDSKYSEILLLKYKYGYSIQEIADTLCLSFSTVKGRLNYGRKKLAMQLNTTDEI